MIPSRNTEVFYIEDQQIRSRYVTEIYIPDEYLENSKSMETGTTYTVLGILPYSVIIAGKVAYSDTLKFPQLMSINIPEKRKDQVRLSKYTEGPTPVTVLLFQPGENIASEYTEANMMNAEVILNMLLGGSIPSTTSYWDVFFLIMDCFGLNDLKIPLPTFIIEDMIATLYRSPKNPDH